MLGGFFSGDHRDQIYDTQTSKTKGPDVIANAFERVKRGREKNTINKSVTIKTKRDKKKKRKQKRQEAPVATETTAIAGDGDECIADLEKKEREGLAVY